MITVHKAKLFIHQNALLGEEIELDVLNACGYAISQDLVSPINFPSFRQSAMDGYAIRLQDSKVDQPFSVEQEIQAGSIATDIRLKPQEAIRIFTGAFVPEDADTIVMQEHVTREGNSMIIIHPSVSKGDHIRPIASQTKQGEIVLKKGSVVTPGSAALLAGLGIKTIPVYKKPTCSILTTGKELVQPGSEIHPGQIFESNSYALKLALDEMQIPVQHIIQVDDDIVSTINAIQQALHETDILLITGGVSVGEYDFVIQALEKNVIQSIFHKVKQKPGKPLYFGRSNTKLVFGLPGNPGSVLTCFYQYVVPAIRMYQGYKNPNLLSLQLPLGQAFQKKAGLTYFMKGVINHSQVEILDHQESYKMNAFAEANCLIEIDETCTHLNAGDLVNVHLLKL